MGLFGKKCSICGSKDEVKKLCEHTMLLSTLILGNETGGFSFTEDETKSLNSRILQVVINEGLSQEECYCFACVARILDNNNIKWRVW